MHRSLQKLAKMVIARKNEEVNRRSIPGPSKGSVYIAEPELMPSSFSEEKACLNNWGFPPATPGPAVSLLTQASYGCLYLSAYLTEQGLRLSPELTTNDVLRSACRGERTVCRLCFVHAIQLNTLGQLSPVALPLMVARDLCSLGIETVIINCWEPGDDYSVALGQFWKTLATRSVVEALSELRAHLPQEDPRAGADAFLLVGNPNLTAKDLIPTVIPSPMSVTTAPNLGKPDYRLLITEGPEKGRQIPVYSRTMVNGRPLTIGRPGIKRCDLEIDDPSIPNRVAQLEFHEDKMYLCNLSSDPELLRLNGLTVRHKNRVDGWETIQFGQTKLEIRTGLGERIERPEYTSSRGRYVLKPVTGWDGDTVEPFLLSESFTVVGRQGAFPLNDPSVSRQHAAVVEREGLHLVSPLGDSRVVLNGVEIKEETELSPGDQIQLSQSTVLAYLESAEMSS